MADFRIQKEQNKAANYLDKYFSDQKNLRMVAVNKSQIIITTQKSYSVSLGWIEKTLARLSDTYDLKLLDQKSFDETVLQNKADELGLSVDEYNSLTPEDIRKRRGVLFGA